MALAALLTLALFGQAARAAFIDDVDLDSIVEYDAADDSILGDLAPDCIDGVTCESAPATMSDDMSAEALLACVDRAPDATDLTGPAAAGYDVLIVDVGTSVAEVYDPAVQDRVLAAAGPTDPTDDALAALVRTDDRAARRAEARTATTPSRGGQDTKDTPLKRYRNPHSLATSVNGTRR